jgi:glycosyltransferase involved in cell wall biosynthesis
MLGLTPRSAPIRVMMIGPYPTSPAKFDGGVAAALMYLSHALVVDPAIDLVGVRIAVARHDTESSEKFGWPLVDLPLGRMSLSTLYRRQKSRLRDLVARFRPDVVHAHGADVAGYIAVGCGVPAAVTVHGLLAECAMYQTSIRSRVRGLAAAWLTERHTVRRARHLVAISPYVVRHYGAAIGGVVHEIPNAVSSRFFDVNRKPQSGRLLYAGRISNGKGILELLRAVARTPNVVRLVLAGAAPDRNYLRTVRDEAARLNLLDRVEFAGLLDESALLREFGVAEALVLPSFQETAPMVVQEAMAAGLPVIASDVGGVPYQLEHNVTGWLCKPGSVDELATLIAGLAMDGAAAARIGAAAKAVASERYLASAVARATVSVYRSMLSSTRPGRSSSTKAVMSPGIWTDAS